MLVVFPPSIRHDEAVAPTFYEDYLLERVSLLEVQLSQAMEKIAMISAFFAREAKELKREQKRVRAFADALAESNPQTAKTLTEKYESGAVSAAAGKVENGGRKQYLNEIVAAHDNPNAPLFKHLLDEGVRLLDGGEEKQAFQMLERAALLSPQNARLFVLIAENYYRADKYKQSKIYLERAFELAPGDEKVLLMLGALGADAGDADGARRYLSVPANNRAMSLVVHFIWGMLAAFEENWNESLAAFEQAAQEKAELAELDFLIGCVYFQLRRYDRALEYFQKTVAADFKFSDAWLMQSLVYKISGETADETRMLETLKAKNENAPSAQFHGAEDDLLSTNAIAFRHFKKTPRNLLTGAAPRLSRFFREQMFRAIE